MTKRRWLLALGLGLLVVASQGSPLFAQRGGGGGMRGGGGPGGGFPGGMGMFGRGGGNSIDTALREEVRTELKLTTNQVQSLEQLNEKLQEERRERMGSMRDQFQGIQDLSEDERRERFQSLQQEMAKQQQETRKQVSSILNAEQNARLSQLEFQLYLQRGAVEQALEAAGVELSEADREKLNEAQDAMRQRIQEQMAEIQRKAQEEVLATVVDTAKIKELAGEPFEFATRGPGGPGGPPAFGGNRPGRDAQNARPGRQPQSEEDSGARSTGRRGRRE